MASLQMLGALMLCSARVASLPPGNCSEVQMSLGGQNDISGNWQTQVNDAQINVSHETNASNNFAWSYGEWEVNMTFTNSNCTSLNNDTEFNYDAIIIDVNRPRQETAVPSPEDVKELGSARYPGYTKFPGLGMYRLHDDRLIWADAVEACDEENSYLAVINSQREADAIRKLFRPYNRGLVPVAYLGLSDLRHEGTFLSVLGERLDKLGYDGWESGEPDGRVGEDCVVVSRAGLMSDVICDVPLPYICEAWLLD